MNATAATSGDENRDQQSLPTRRAEHEPSTSVRRREAAISVLAPARAPLVSLCPARHFASMSDMQRIVANVRDYRADAWMSKVIP